MEVINHSGKMAVASGSLNPWAEPYVPGWYRAVEDYSPEWWDLVASSAAFRSYWLRHCFVDGPDAGVEDDDDELLLDDVDNLFHSLPHEEPRAQEEQRETSKRGGGEVVAWGMEKWRRARGAAGGPKYAEKAPKIVSVRVSPRTIQQPR